MLDMLEKKELVQTTIEKICKYYSANENISGILKVVNMDEFGVKRIKIILIYTKLVFEQNYFGFKNCSDKCYICDDVVLLMDSRENIDFGLLGRFNYEKGQPSAYRFLVNGEILYDKTGKYEQLQKEVKKDTTLKRVRNHKPLIPVTRVN